MNRIYLLVLFVALLFISSSVYSRGALYINFAPDMRHTRNGIDSRITLDLDANAYSYAHDFGLITPCETESTTCIVFDFFALHDIEEDAGAGSEYLKGDFRFEVIREYDLLILGQQHTVFQVDVFKKGEHSNSYLFNADSGVMAIMTPDFNNKKAPGSIYFLAGTSGIFAR